MFENQEAVEKIFTRWHERFGRSDRDEAIHLAIIKQISLINPAHYEVLVTSSQAICLENKSTGPVALLGRHMTVTPDTSVNLDRFMVEYKRAGAYLLIPAILEEGKPEPLMKLSVFKRRLIVKYSDNIRPHDVEVMAFPDKMRQRGDSAAN